LLAPKYKRRAVDNHNNSVVDNIRRELNKLSKDPAFLPVDIADVQKGVSRLKTSVQNSNKDLATALRLVSNQDPDLFFEEISVVERVSQRNLKSLSSAVENLRQIRDEQTIFETDIQERARFDAQISGLIGEIQVIKSNQQNFHQGFSGLINEAHEDIEKSLNSWHLKMIRHMNESKILK